MSKKIGDVDGIGNIVAWSTGCQQATQDIVQDLLFKNLNESYLWLLKIVNVTDIQVFLLIWPQHSQYPKSCTHSIMDTLFQIFTLEMLLLLLCSVLLVYVKYVAMSSLLYDQRYNVHACKKRWRILAEYCCIKAHYENG